MSNPPPPSRRLTRAQLVGGAAASVLAAGGIYKLVDELTAPPAREIAGSLRSEQHLLDGIRVVRDNGVEVLVPPLHHQVVTANVRTGESAAELREARQELENGLQRLDERFDPTPSGLGVTVAWGLPYFTRYVPAQTEKHLPLDVRATATRGRPVRVLEDAIRFPSDPDTTRLEKNDLAIVLRSDSLEHIAEGTRVLFDELDDVFRVTSIRKGFVGGGLEGGPGLPKQMALAAGINGAELIPDGAQLFLGFTSTQKAGLGPARIANLETLGYADLGPSDYFAQGTHLHLSHLFEDVAAWYQVFDFQARLDTTFRPGLVAPQATQTVAQGSERRPERGARPARLRASPANRPLGVDSDRRPALPVMSSALTARAIRRERRSRSGPTSTRSTTRSSGPRTRSETRSRRSRPQVSTSWCSTPRATTFGERGWRWTGSCREGRVSFSSREAAAEASTRFSRRRIGRTSSSPLAHTARSPCPSFRVGARPT